MKYLLTMVLGLIISVPAVGQRVQHDKRVYGKAKVEKHEDNKGCSKCAALKKQVEGMRKRMSEVMKDKKASKGRPATRGKRGERSSRGRSSRFGGNRSTSRRSGPPSKKGPPAKTKKAMEDRRKEWIDVNSDERKKWEDLIRKRLQGSINEYRKTDESRKIDWRKFAEMRK